MYIPGRLTDLPPVPRVGMPGTWHPGSFLIFIPSFDRSAMKPRRIRTLLSSTRLYLSVGLMAVASVLGAALSEEAWRELVRERHQDWAAFAYVRNNPALPNVLIYGDSISIAYTPRVRDKLQEKANVYRIHTNGGESASFVPKMKLMVETMTDPGLTEPWEFQWDVVHFNVGLHDLKYFFEGKLDKERGTQIASTEAYQNNLRAIIAYLRRAAPEATLVFTTTTPVPEDSDGRFAGDAQRYNQAALEVLQAYPEVVINDLYSFTKPHQQSWWTRPGNVHFVEQGFNAQGDEVARIIEEALESRKSAAAAPEEQLADHPRAFLSPEAWNDARRKVQTSPYRDWMESMKASLRSRIQNGFEYDRPQYEWAWTAANCGLLFALTDEAYWAEQAWQLSDMVIDDKVFTQDPFSFGLSRAALLQGLALAYDFSYHGWTPAQRHRANVALYDLMVSVHTTMGHSANYSTASNWMGVRWGSVLLASLLVDPPPEFDGRHEPADAFQWDSRERLVSHIAENTFSNGWNGESLGYYSYNWSFIAPALWALSNQLGWEQGRALQRFAPEAINGLHGLATATVIQDGTNRWALKPDLSDDNPNSFPIHLFGIGLGLYPIEQQPYVRWFHDYLWGAQDGAHQRGWNKFSLLTHQANQRAINPAEAGWLNYHDPEQGNALFRNRFQDHEDIVFAYTATATRVRGHNGPDTNTFRLIGLGTPWIIGGGRTGATAGQTNLFPIPAQTLEKGNSRSLGILSDHHFNLNGTGGWARGSGSQTGVTDHERFVAVNYDPATGAAGAFLVADQSTNGERLRICTPEFNKLEPQADGFILTAPNGATLRARVAPPFLDAFKIETQTLRYGGTTIRNNSGIRFQGERYPNSLAIDLYCQGDITVLFTLQPAGQPHPGLEWNAQDGRVKVGGRWIETR